MKREFVDNGVLQQGKVYSPRLRRGATAGVGMSLLVFYRRIQRGQPQGEAWLVARRVGLAGAKDANFLLVLLAASPKDSLGAGFTWKIRTSEPMYKGWSLTPWRMLRQSVDDPLAASWQRKLRQLGCVYSSLATQERVHACSQAAQGALFSWGLGSLFRLFQFPT